MSHKYHVINLNPWEHLFFNNGIYGWVSLKWKREQSQCLHLFFSFLLCFSTKCTTCSVWFLNVSRNYAITLKHCGTDFITNAKSNWFDISDKCSAVYRC